MQSRHWWQFDQDWTVLVSSSAFLNFLNFKKKIKIFISFSSSNPGQTATNVLTE
jgi:hypothetical protein